MEKITRIEPVCPYDWQVTDVDEATVIYGWCLNESNQSVLIRIEDYPVKAFLEINQSWGPLEISEFSDWLRRTLGDDKPTAIKAVKKQKLYYYNHGKKYLMLELYFSSLNAMRHCEKLVAKKDMKMFETKIPLIRKFLTSCNLSFSGWFNGLGTRVEDQISRCDKEFIIKYASIKSLATEMTGKTTYPKILSIDIECYSHNPKAMPKKMIAKDIIFAVSCIVGRIGDPSRKRYMVAIGSPEHIQCQTAEIICCKDEHELLYQLRQLILKVNPDVLIGYNTLGFDYPYLDHRLKRFVEGWDDLSKLQGYQCTMDKMSWESSAFRYNEFYIFKVPGRISIDLYPIISRDYKLIRYDLDTVSKNFLGRGKHPVKAKDIFEWTGDYMKMWSDGIVNKETIDAYNKVLDYCVEDTELVFDLLEKLSIWIGLVELSNIVGVSITDLFTRGQQIRCLSQIYDIATRDDIVIDSRDNKSDIAFAGGFVQEPIPGLYDNVICLDFASLYPSIIQAMNICYTTLVRPEDEGIQLDQVNPVKVDLSTDEMDDGTDDKEDEDSSPSGKRIVAVHRFVKRDVYHGVLPRLVAKLVDERKAVRKLLEGMKDPTTKIVLDKRQLALKISANSVFGFLGVANGKLPLMEGAVSITATGRDLIGTVNRYLEDKYKAKIVYNDSVAEYTPILIRKNNMIDYIQIKDLTNLYYEREDGKEEFLIDDTEIWSDLGWTKIKRVIRHKTDKKMYRILTHTGLVDATEDHSLLNENAEEVRPKDVKIGQILLHKDLPEFEIDTGISEDLAWVFGFFYAEGSCGTYNCKSGKKTSWAISNQENEPLEKCKIILEKYYPQNKYYIGDYMKSSNCNKLQANGTNLEQFVKYFRDMFYCERNEENVAFKVVPKIILNSRKEIKKAFLDGYYEGDGLKAVNNKIWDNKGHIGSAGLYFIATSIGYKASLNIRKDKFSVVRTTCTKTYQRKNTDSIKKIIEIGNCSGYVYDIETENHHFAAGVGRLIVHNTDSSMIDLGIKDTKQCNEWGHKLSAEISSLFPPPIKMEFEKAMRMLCIKKKKYAAFLVDKHGVLNTDRKKMLVRGIVLARRDASPWLQKIYAELLNNVMMRQTMDSSIQMIYQAVEDLMTKKVDISHLVTVRQLSAVYKSPTYFMKVYADNLKKMGFNVNPGDRLEYLIIKKDVKLLGDRMIPPEVYKEGGHELDVVYYLDHLLKNPIDQLFSVGHKEDLKPYAHIGFQTKRKLVCVSTPISMILVALDNGSTIEEIKEFLMH
jgi:DNA polymerase elongation subunit (family B)